MKKSRIAKLALMGASITALAATLTTSTYAWYVSSKTTYTNTVTGATTSAGADGSITLSVDGKKGSYYPTITISKSGDDLYPVTSTNGTTFTTMAGGATTQYYKFEFYIMSDADVTKVTPTITITNKSATETKQINYSQAETSPIAAGNSTIANGQEFTINALQALYISQTTLEGKSMASAANETAWEAGTSATPVTQAEAVYTGTTKGAKLEVVPAAGAAKFDGTGYKVATAGANAYYDEIMKTSDATTGASTWSTAFGSLDALNDFALTANTPKKLTYYVWLEGYDDQCFNCCAGQGLEFNFSYTAA